MRLAGPWDRGCPGIRRASGILETGKRPRVDSQRREPRPVAGTGRSAESLAAAWPWDEVRPGRNSWHWLCTIDLIRSLHRRSREKTTNLPGIAVPREAGNDRWRNV